MLGGPGAEERTGAGDRAGRTAKHHGEDPAEPSEGPRWEVYLIPDPFRAKPATGGQSPAE